MKLLLAVPINIYDLRMNDISTQRTVCLQTLDYSVLIGVANAFSAQIIHMITCSEVFAKSPAFLDSILAYSGQIKNNVVRYRRKDSVLGEMYCYSFTSGKTYLVIQTWRLVKWFRYPTYFNCFRTTLFNHSPSVFGGRSGILA